MKNRHAITLVDMLLAISLLVVFMLLGSRLLVANFKAEKTILQSMGNTTRFDQAIAMLRADVHQADSLSMPRPNLLRLHIPPDQTIEWHKGSNQLQRQLPSSIHQWNLTQPVDLKLDGPVVLVSSGPGDSLAISPLPTTNPVAEKQ